MFLVSCFLFHNDVMPSSRLSSSDEKDDSPKASHLESSLLGMHYYEVYLADSHYRSSQPLTYSYDGKLKPLAVVTLPLQKRMVTGFVMREVSKPSFATKPIKTLLSDQSLPKQCLQLAQWLADYYATTLSDALRQFTPVTTTIRRAQPVPPIVDTAAVQIEFNLPLTPDQSQAIKAVLKNKSTTLLLHGDTGTGKTRVYLELAQKVLATGRSVMLLTPEIALTTQLAAAVEQLLPHPTYVLHSQLPAAKRKKLWFKVLEATEPVIIIGPRSALFAPLKNLGLIVVDEAHEPAYKQEQSPRYNALRVASQLGAISGAKVILGTATPSVADYYLAQRKKAVVRMKTLAIKHSHGDPVTEIIDIKERRNFTRNPYLSNQLIKAMDKELAAKKQVMIYLNRRGSARLILCSSCGWQMLCPHCDLPLVYHGDKHIVRCHICGFSQAPPMQCPKCRNPDIIYRSIGTKALIENIAKLFPRYRLARFDSDNIAGEHINEVYGRLRAGEVDILVGTQLLAKGFDLPRLNLVGIVSAETSLALPDFTSEERAFQLLYQVMGRVGRGHGRGHIIIQSTDSTNIVIKSALKRDWPSFYKQALAERQAFRFPPFAYLLQLTCRRATESGAQQAAENLKKKLAAKKLPVEIIGPAPSFYARRGKYFYYQLVAKSKDRDHLVTLAKEVPADWTVDLDPINLL